MICITETSIMSEILSPTRNIVSLNISYKKSLSILHRILTFTVRSILFLKNLVN